MVAVPGEYLVNYGRSGFLGRFVNASGVDFQRDERVVVRSSRGIEAGIVLGEASARFAHLVGVAGGEILRRFDSEDAARDDDNSQRARDLASETQQEADNLGLPLAVLDVEIVLDGQQVIVQLLPFVDCDLSPLREWIARQHNILVSFFDVRTPVQAESGGCGKPGCGSSGGSCGDCGSGGCSSGSCSSGKVKNSRELTEYFVQLREKMERESARRSLVD